MLSAFAMLVACSGQPATPVALAPEGPDLPDLVVVTVDTLRPDHLGAWGHTRETSPWLDARAAEGVLFERAYSTSAWTAPAMASLMTGLYPSEHGVRTALTAGQPTRPGLPLAVPTLAETLKAKGYATWAVTSNLHLSSEMGFGRGFDSFRALGMVDDGNQVVQVVEEWAPSPAPTLLWVHLLDPHGPYWPNSPWMEGFLVDEGLGTDLVAPLYPKTAPQHDANPALTPGSDGLKVLELLYDSEIRLVDALLERMHAALPSSDSPLWAVTSDHGEAFREHGRIGHWLSLYEEEVRVPMLLFGGGLERQRVQHPVNLLHLNDALVALASGQEPHFAERPLLLETNYRDGRPGAERGLLRGSLKQIEGRVYDLSKDPGEVHPTEADPAPVTDAFSALTRHEPSSVAVTEDVRELELLRAMGYVDE